jgi:hypothetical protein
VITVAQRTESSRQSVQIATVIHNGVITVAQRTESGRHSVRIATVIERTGAPRSLEPWSSSTAARRATT